MRLPVIDVFSFWLGFAVAAAVAFLLYRLRRSLGAGQQTLFKRLRGVREIFTSGAERRLREDVLRYAQTSHLAGALFALDEVLLPPRVLWSPPPFDPSAPLPDLDLTAAIPVLPDWPDLAALYQAPSLEASQALAGSSHLLILGAPGTGKTTLLAHLVSRVAQGDTTLLGDEYTPIFVHAADLGLPQPAAATVAEPLVAAVQARASTLTAARLPRHLRTRLRDYRCAIFLDGLDELPPGSIAEAAEWLGRLMQEYPQHRLIVASGLTGYAPLLSLGLAPAHIAPWDAAGYRLLVQKWAAAWDKAVRSRRKGAPDDTDPQLIMGWLSTGNQGRTIFEVSLKVWAAFAGDARGKRPWDWVEAYVLRHGIKPLGQRALGRLAAAMLEHELSAGLARAEAEALLASVFGGPAGTAQMDPHEFIDDAVARRLLARHRNRVRFNHALTAAFCAATALAAEPDVTVPDRTEAWARALYFFAPAGDLSSAVARRLEHAPDLLHADLLACARWLRDSPAQARWRNDVLRRLAKVLTDPANASGLRTRALAGFVAAGDPAVAAFFKQHLASSDALLRQSAVLGLGALNEVSTVPQVAALFGDPKVEVRWAAALALSVMSHASALEELARGLLTGDDTVRRACAEALARHAEEGHPVLQEAIEHADLGVRRAAVFGLAATRADWALALLQAMQHREPEWLVRSAIQDALGQWTDIGARAPRPYPPPEHQGWLVAWAAELGLGVPPGRGALEVLGRALKEGDEPTREAAAGVVSQLGDPAGARELYPLLRDPVPALREAGFEALATLSAASGQRLAAPA